MRRDVPDILILNASIVQELLQTLSVKIFRISTKTKIYVGQLEGLLVACSLCLRYIEYLCCCCCYCCCAGRLQLSVFKLADVLNFPDKLLFHINELIGSNIWTTSEIRRARDGIRRNLRFACGDELYINTIIHSFIHS